MQLRRTSQRLVGATMAAAALVFAVNGGRAFGATIADTESVSAPTTLINNAFDGYSDGGSPTLYASFAGFNTSLGTLTGVSFALNYNFSTSLTAPGGGGNFVIQGPDNVVGGGTYQAGTTSFPTIGASGSYNETQTISVPSLTALAPPGTFNSAYQFGLQSESSFVGGGPSGAYGTLTLTSGTVSATYTYTAVPEPASLAVIGIPAAMALLRRRRAI